MCRCGLVTDAKGQVKQGARTNDRKIENSKTAIPTTVLSATKFPRICTVKINHCQRILAAVASPNGKKGTSEKKVRK